jgi:hypothetical protein
MPSADPVRDSICLVPLIVITNRHNATSDADYFFFFFADRL